MAPKTPLRVSVSVDLTEPSSNCAHSLRTAVTTDHLHRASDSKTMRVLMMGSSRVGKSSLIQRIIQLNSTSKNRPILKPVNKNADEMHRLDVPIGGSKSMHVELLDTSGYQSFPVMRELAIRQAQAFILVCGLDDESSFEYVRELRQEILRVKLEQDSAQRPVMVVVANKSDLPRNMCKFDVAYAELVVECDWQDCGFVCCSAIEKNNIHGIWRALRRQYGNYLTELNHAPLINPSSHRASLPSITQPKTVVPPVQRAESFPRKPKMERRPSRFVDEEPEEPSSPQCLVQ